TPERLGLCGAVSWLDAKATKELDPTGPCQPIEKGECLDDRTGFHYFLNYIEGVMHVGQRDMAWVNQDAFDKGFRLEHIGEV
ncbi:hypothetical protein, partial [Clostridioides difficile]|uniref:hypothetical protein n=1 Tax=Clostridioides difficile TaxID=1496 RepID=UPI001F1C1B5A